MVRRRTTSAWRVLPARMDDADEPVGQPELHLVGDGRGDAVAGDECGEVLEPAADQLGPGATGLVRDDVVEELGLVAVVAVQVRGRNPGLGGFVAAMLYDTVGPALLATLPPAASSRPSTSTPPSSVRPPPAG